MAGRGREQSAVGLPRLRIADEEVAQSSVLITHPRLGRLWHRRDVPVDREQLIGVRAVPRVETAEGGPGPRFQPGDDRPCRRVRWRVLCAPVGSTGLEQDIEIQEVTI